MSKATIKNPKVPRTHSVQTVLVQAQSAEHPVLRSDETLAFQRGPAIVCQLCETPLLHPSRNTPLGSAPVYVENSPSSDPRSIKPTRVVCQCCALEIHLPTLSDHLANQRVLVYGWENQPVFAPRCINGWARLLYATLALRDSVSKGDPDYTPILANTEIVVAGLRETILDESEYSFTPVWSMDVRLTESLGRVARQLGLPRLPEPGTTSSDGRLTPSGRAWLGPAWATIAKEHPSFWRGFRQHLLLVPGPSICYNPAWDATDEILFNTPENELLGAAIHFYKKAGIV